MGKLLNFHRKQTQPELPKEELSFGEAEDWLDAVQAMQERFGGASLSDLEDGDEEAVKTAERALAKEWLVMHTEDMNRK